MQQQFEADEVCQALGVGAVMYRGTGSFGETWRADFDEQDAAYKIIYKDGYDLQRLSREVASYRRIDHPNVVALLDIRQAHIRGVDRPVMVFEYIDGCDLSDVVADVRPSAAELRALASGLLAGVSAMHAADLLHRDLKPANVALRGGNYGNPVILDLGLAKLLDVETITTYPTLVGTTLYMAPEQLRQERALRASDLWAVGELLFEAAVGSHPFFRPGESLTIGEAMKRLSAPPEMPSTLPPDVAILIVRCLSDPPYRRGTVAKALSLLAGG
ncbi:serine/threonine-protein kinase [Kribbella sp. NPDC059898]|uniref:serine/threonine-protein kinase n=1 Tax=Kribbella sp. NPDC059898 TaxID=3346995 RepID=UPI00366A1FA0